MQLAVNRMEFKAKFWNTENDLLIQIAQFAYEKNLVRQGDEYYYFTSGECWRMTGMCAGENNWTYRKEGFRTEKKYMKSFEGRSHIDGAWVFLDDTNENEGCIRLFPKCSKNGHRAKYSFWKDDENKIQICEA